MEVRRLHVQGYRSLVDVTVDLGQVTVVTGTNGSGKSNLYRALRLAQACASGDLGRRVVQEGGMPSIVHAGDRRGEPKVHLAVDLDGLTYEIDLATVSRGQRPEESAASFPLDPKVTQERILLPGPANRRVDLLDRSGTTAFVRDDDGNRVAYAAAFHPSESVLAQLLDARHFPELAYVRETLRGMRFHHQVRTDDDAPARRPALGTRTVAVADDGADLAAALATIERDGDRRTLTHAVATAFDGAGLAVEEDDVGRLDAGLHVPALHRRLSAAELSDGQLRFLFLAAALLAPRPPSVLVLNEPESSLHVDLLPALAELVRAAAERTQVLLTTHAAPLAEALAGGSEVVLLELSAAGGGTTVARR